MYNEFSIPHEILEDSKFKKLTSGAKVLYLYLAKLRNRYCRKQKDKFWRSIDTLSDDTGLHAKTIKMARQQLLKAGFIEIERGHYASKGYRSPDWYKLNGYKAQKPKV